MAKIYMLESGLSCPEPMGRKEWFDKHDYFTLEFDSDSRVTFRSLDSYVRGDHHDVWEAGICEVETHTENDSYMKLVTASGVTYHVTITGMEFKACE